jgi:hypothetical protein
MEAGTRMVGAPTTAPATATTTDTAPTTATAHLTGAESMILPDMAAPDPDEVAGTKTNTAAPGEKLWLHEGPLPSLPRPQGGRQTGKILNSELQQYKDVIFFSKKLCKKSL